MNQPNLVSDLERKNRLQQIYNDFLLKIKKLKTNFNTKITNIVKQRDEQKEEELRNKIKQL